MAEPNWLKDIGYNPLALPRRDLRPTDVLLKDGGRFATKVGDVTMLVSSDGDLPEVASDEPTASIGRQVTRHLELSLGLKVLGALLGAGVAGKLGADSAYTRARTLDVTYEDVLQDSLPVIPLQGWLERGHVIAPSAVALWLNDDKLACVTAVLRTAKLSVSAKREGGASLDLSLPEISGIVSGEGKVSAETADTTKLTFEGKEPIVFGFQAFQMRYEGNVNLGLEQVRGVAPGDYYSRDAWTGDTELEAIGDAPLPAA